MSTSSSPPDPEPDEPRYTGDPHCATTTYVYDCQGRIQSIDCGDGRGPMPATPTPRLFRWEHLPEKRLFALTELWDGKTQHWRDNPTRYLVVEIDDETGEIRPAVKNRKPVYLWLCREEREAR